MIQSNVQTINKAITQNKQSDPNFKSGEISDTHHTFDELYYCRMMLSAVLFSTYSTQAWKSRLHDDGSMFDNMFIVGVETPEGPFTFHYDLCDWDKFEVTELERGRPWDGHTAKDIGRLLSLLTHDI